MKKHLFSVLSGDESVMRIDEVADTCELVAYIHYVLVYLDYQGRKIAGTMLNKVKEKYKDFLYIEVMPDESKNAAFYQKFGFEIMEDGVAMQLCNLGNRH